MGRGNRNVAVIDKSSEASRSRASTLDSDELRERLDQIAPSLQQKIINDSKNYSWASVKYETDETRNCEESGCRRDGICRCRKIQSAWVESFYYDEFEDGVINDLSKSAQLQSKEIAHWIRYYDQGRAMKDSSREEQTLAYAKVVAEQTELENERSVDDVSETQKKTPYFFTPAVADKLVNLSSDQENKLREIIRSRGIDKDSFQVPFSGGLYGDEVEGAYLDSSVVNDLSLELEEELDSW